MATQDVIALHELLGKTLVLTEHALGFDFERRGQVIGIVTTLPGSRSEPAFLLDQDDGDCVYYSPNDVTISFIV